MSNNEYSYNRSSMSNVLKLLGVKSKEKDIKRTQLLMDLKAAVDELEEIRQNFEYIDEPELIEYAIYKEKALLNKVSYLIRQAKIEDELSEQVSL